MAQRLPFEQFLNRALEMVEALEAVELPLAWAGGRMTAAPVSAAAPAPSFTNSAMDGFAINTDDLSGTGSVTLPVIGDIAAGEFGDWHPGAAVRIMTGAPIPPGVNTVIPVEFTDHPSTRAPLPETVTVPGDWQAEKNIRYEGSDIEKGEELFDAGVLLNGPALAALAGVGVTHVDVWPRVKVGVIITGDEVVTHDPGPGQVLDSNSLLIAQAVEDFGAALTHAETSGDDPTEFNEVVDRLLPEVDLLITTGGASVGAHDVARHALTERGLTFRAVAMQPAKPQGFGVLEGIPVCALPGNPGAVHASLHAIVRPILEKLGRLHPAHVEHLPVIQGWTARKGLRQFVPVRIAPEGILPAIPGGVAAHRVRSLAMADGLANVGPDIGEIRAGDVLPVIRTRAEA